MPGLNYASVLDTQKKSPVSGHRTLFFCAFFGNLLFFCQHDIHLYTVIGTRPNYPYTKNGG